MKPQEITEAFEVLEALDKIEGQARNKRLDLLRLHAGNSVLKTIFKSAYDWRIELGMNPIGLALKVAYQNAPTSTLEHSYSEFLELISETRSKSGSFLLNRRKLRRFLDFAHPLLAKWSLRVFERDLKIYLSTKMIGKIWGSDICIPFHVPLALQQRTNGIRTFIFIYNGQPVTFTEGFRKFTVANDCFAKQFGRVVDNAVIEGWVTSNDWELSHSLLSHHISTMSKPGFKSLYYGLKFEAMNLYQPHEFEQGNFQAHNQELIKIIARLNPRTSIKLSQEFGKPSRFESFCNKTIPEGLSQNY